MLILWSQQPILTSVFLEWSHSTKVVIIQVANVYLQRHQSSTVVYYVSKWIGWVGSEFLLFLLNFGTVFMLTQKVGGSEKVTKCTDVIQGWSKSKKGVVHSRGGQSFSVKRQLPLIMCSQYGELFKDIQDHQVRFNSVCVPHLLLLRHM